MKILVGILIVIIVILIGFFALFFYVFKSDAGRHIRESIRSGIEAGAQRAGESQARMAIGMRIDAYRNLCFDIFHDWDKVHEADAELENKLEKEYKENGKIDMVMVDRSIVALLRKTGDKYKGRGEIEIAEACYQGAMKFEQKKI